MADIHDVKALIDVLDPKKTRDAVVNFYNTHSIENWSNLDKIYTYAINRDIIQRKGLQFLRAFLF